MFENLRLTIDYWPIEKLLPYARNPRKNDHAVEKAASWIREFGFRVPILAKSDGTIIDGHLRLKAAKKLGMKELPVTNADDMSEVQIKAFRLSVNKMSELADWDDDLLKLELEELDNLQYDIDSLDFKDIDFEKSNTGTDGLTDPDEVPEVPQNVFGVKRGDVWLLGNHRIMCGDSTSEDDVKNLMDGKVADMVWTDPPYNVALGMDETAEQAKARGRRTDGLVVKNDNMSDTDFREFLLIVFKNYINSTKKGGAIYVAHADIEGYNFRGAMRDAGWMVKQCLIWVKSSLVMGRQDYQWRHEPILYGWKEGAAHTWFSDRKQSTVMEFDKPSRNEFHPTMKPVELVEYNVKNSSKSGELIIDFFSGSGSGSGSGSTLIACEKTGRTCYGMELDEHYVSVIIKRWQDFTGKTAIKEE
jgi:site-specific DNA-methyltransferase (adenine-specific)